GRPALVRRRTVLVAVVVVVAVVALALASMGGGTLLPHRLAALGRLVRIHRLATALLLRLGPERRLDVVDDLVLLEQLFFELATPLMELALLQAADDLILERVLGQLPGRPLSRDLDDVVAELRLHRLG